MCSSSPVRTPKLQWAVGQLLTGGRWNPSPEKDTPCSKTKEKPQWHGRRGAIMIKSNPTSSRCTTHKLENNSTKEPAKVLGPKTDIPTWGSGKGIGNPQGIWLWRTEAFDYSTLKGLGKQRLLEGTKKSCVYPDPGERSRDPQETEPDLPWLFEGLLQRHGQQWPAAGTGALAPTDLGGVGSRNSFWRSPAALP